MRNNPIRCFEGNAKPYEPFWRTRNTAETGGNPEMEFYGVISEYSWFEDDITPKKFKSDLYALNNGGDITLRIDSPGGDVIAASVIRSIMSDYPGQITVRIDGLAASAAVIVAMAGSKVLIMDTAYMMIHDPAVIAMFAVLDIETTGRLHDQLKSIKTGIVDTYATKTGLSQEKISRLMSEETWMSAREAVVYGFATEVIDGGQKKLNNSFTNLAFVNLLKSYVNIPSQLIPSNQPATDDIDQEVVEEDSFLDEVFILSV